MSLDAEDWEQLQSLFHLGEQAQDAELDDILLAACDTPELRQRVAALVRASRQKSEPEAPAVRPVGGRSIGPYTILRHLGSGGIGTVYLVERTTAGLVQKAALKVLTRDAAGPFFADRFAREQHILASLDHPNITRLLDAGFSDEGEPYLTMEYVDGVHLDAYCDDRSLGIPERLQLFLRVCEAVAYAHRSLVVHLDLKPSNILVTEAGGVVKLLDFGTSKLIQPGSLFTTTVMATPAYASPEQLRNEPVTTVCDVYALGAILFELLSGRRPNQNSSVAAMIERSMMELPPESVTAGVTAASAGHRGLTETRLRSLLTGDLATIVAKCISPRPKDRFATVEALIADVQRYLAGRPILARPQTTTYRLSKFVRRNRILVVTAGALICCILVIGSYAAWKQELAFREGRRALQMQGFMSELFKLANTNYMGKPAATVPEFLRLGVHLLPNLIDNPVDRRAAQLSLAESMFDDDDLADAGEVFASVIEEAKRSGDKATLAEAEAYSGTIMYRAGETETSTSLLADSLALSRNSGVSPAVRNQIVLYFVENRMNRGIRTPEDEALLRTAVIDSRRQKLPDRERAKAVFFLAEYLSYKGDLLEAKALASEALNIYSGEPYALCDQADARVILANIQTMGGDTAGSLPNYKRAYYDFQTCSGDASSNTLLTQVFMARAMIKLGHAKEVIPILESSLPNWRKAFPGSPNLCEPLRFLAMAYIQTSQFDKAESYATQAIQATVGKANPNSPRVALLELVLAQALQGQGRNADALHHAEISDREYAAVPAMSAVEKSYALQAHQLVSDLGQKGDMH